jgi:O-antigen/teichoic acid export membrane protein
LARKETEKLPSNSENNKKIVKNTLALYFRQILTMFVALFTSRIVLQTLGVDDYGLNNVVGGVVGMLAFLTASLSGTTQRFLNVEKGKNNRDGLKQIFANSLSLHLIFILFAAIFAETVGLWFLQNKLNIPEGRESAAFWVFQFSVVSFCLGVFFAPFDGAIKAHEKFSFYAKMSILDVAMRLVIAFSLIYLPYDKLIAWSLMGKCVLLVRNIVIYVYCHRNFEECRIRFSFSKNRLRQLLGYNFYAMINSVSAIMKGQGLNIVLNLYYGAALNAAQGIANTVKVSLASFSGNAMIATKPQIIMSYAQKNKQRFWSLMTNSSRFYFYLMLILALPFILEIDTALYIWLGNYPKHASSFAQIFLLDALINTLWSPIGHANAAVGRLRAATINLIICRSLVLLSAVLIGMNQLPAVYIYISYLILQAVCLFIYMIIVIKYMLKLSLRKYFVDVILPILKTLFFVVPLPIALHYFFSKTVTLSCIVGFFTFIWSVAMVFCIGLNKHERQMIISKLRQFFASRQGK